MSRMCVRVCVCFLYIYKQRVQSAAHTQRNGASNLRAVSGGYSYAPGDMHFSVGHHWSWRWSLRGGVAVAWVAAATTGQVVRPIRVLRALFHSLFIKAFTSCARVCGLRGGSGTVTRRRPGSLKVLGFWCCFKLTFHSGVTRELRERPGASRRAPVPVDNTIYILAHYAVAPLEPTKTGLLEKRIAKISKFFRFFLFISSHFWRYDLGADHSLTKDFFCAK